MNHNPYNLKPGDGVLLDQKHEPIEVTIVSMTEKKMYSRIEYEDNGRTYQWEVMTNRLTPKPAN